MKNFEKYTKANYPLPGASLAWNLYGAGIENIGKDRQPETFSILEPADNQLLVRIDSVGMCFSDIKIMQQGRNHPKLYNRDLLKEPGRLGHEVSLTVIKVGKSLQDDYFPGQRLAVQPDIYQNGRSTAYGYTIPGGLIQYHLIGPEILDTDEGPCLLPLTTEISYAAASLLEPWGCVIAAYTQRRRLKPKDNGVMWIIGKPDDTRKYQFSTGLEKPKTIVLTDVPKRIKNLVKEAGATVIEANGLKEIDYAKLSSNITGGSGFDDIIILNPSSANTISEISKLIARRGTLNMVGQSTLDNLVEADVGRLHYDYIAFIGNKGPDIAASYGEARNRCELKPGGVAVFIGAGGPMGQMHVQRALEMAGGPSVIIATEINEDRLDTLRNKFLLLAGKNNCKLHVVNPNTVDGGLANLIHKVSNGKGADDVVVTVPSAKLMAESAAMMNENGMLVLFAGVPNGTMAPLNLSNVYLENAQYTGTSGLSIDDQAMVLIKTREGKLSPGRMVAAIGGMNAAIEALEAVINNEYPGKIVIFPQIEDLPLMGLDEVSQKLPEVAEKMESGNVWTMESEAVLFEKFWKL